MCSVRIVAVFMRVHEAVACTWATGQLLRDCSAMAFQLVLGQRSGSEFDYLPDWSITYISLTFFGHALATML